MKFRTPYNYDTQESSLENSLEFTEPSLTQQEFHDETDINNIVARYGLTNLPNVEGWEFTDRSDMPDNLQDAILFAKDAKNAFENLDPIIKGQYNTPYEFMKAYDENPEIFVSEAAARKAASEKIEENVVPVASGTPPNPGAPIGATPAPENPSQNNK